MYKNDLREDIGYTKPSAHHQPDWSHKVLSSKKHICPTVSPIMQWWIDQQSKLGVEVHQKQNSIWVRKEIDNFLGK